MNPQTKDTSTRVAHPGEPLRGHPTPGSATVPVSLHYHLDTASKQVDALFEELHGLSEALGGLLMKNFDASEPAPPVDDGMPTFVALAHSLDHRLMVATQMLVNLRSRLAT